MKKLITTISNSDDDGITTTKSMCSCNKSYYRNSENEK